MSICKSKFYRELSGDGTIKYEGYGIYNEAAGHMVRCGFGISYSKEGKVIAVGIFEKAGLVKGRLYYPNGNVKYEGKFLHKQVSKDGKGSYYGPTYPTTGKYYKEDGKLLYEGQICVERIGNLSYPIVIWPDGKRENVAM